MSCLPRLGVGLYGLLWKAARPFLRRHKRLARDFDRRLALAAPPDGRPVDIWIQAASGGEAFLARNLLHCLETLSPPEPGLRLLCTACTRQGLDVLEETAARMRERASPHLAIPRLFPLDEPAIMRQALAAARPRLVALLETELWPGLLLACAETHTPVVLLNGRMRDATLRQYRLLRFLWNRTAPVRTLAVSEPDAARFAVLFGPERVSVMPNMKFDLAPLDEGPACGIPPPRQDCPCILFASVREQEEPLLLPVLDALVRQAPHAALVLAPRHMERVPFWRARLQAGRLPTTLRSELPEPLPPLPPGRLTLWDRFGELRDLYARADAVFVGGSLAPLGGQNFLEALNAGVTPCIGPSYGNFAWVGAELFQSGLAQVIPDARALAPALLEQLAAPADKSAVRRRFADYLAPRRGGSELAAAALLSLLRDGEHSAVLSLTKASGVLNSLHEDSQQQDPAGNTTSPL